jgi:tetratricopeptide (TPR) repeat protein
MLKAKWPLLFVLAFLACGCASFEASRQTLAGRRALLIGSPDVALGHFQKAAQLDPNHAEHFGVLREGVWTYVGRTQYQLGRLPEARKSLERAIAQDRNDYLARLYLGLTLARDGDREKGVRELESGMRGIYDWLEFVTYNTSWGHFWDPRREIRSEIRSTLGPLSGKEYDLERVIASGEWVGHRFEEEIDRARYDEIQDLRRRTDGGGAGDTP